MVVRKKVFCNLQSRIGKEVVVADFNVILRQSPGETEISKRRFCSG